MATPEPILDISGLEVRYGTVPAIRGLDLSIGRGEIVGLIGPNGAGKSTTLHAIMGAVRPSAGDVRLDGLSIRGRAPEQVVRAGIALVPEGRRIFAELTVEENLRLGLSGRRSKAGADEAVERVLRAVPNHPRDAASSRRALVGWAAAAARDRPSARGRSERAPPRRAVARACTDRRRQSVRGSGSDQGAGRHDPPGRATRAAHRRFRGSDLCHLQRRASVDSRPAGCGRYASHGRGVLRQVMTEHVQTLVDAIALGSIYALMAVGIGLVFGVLRLVNFAYGQLIMAGAYALALTNDSPVLAEHRALLRGRSGALTRHGVRRVSPAPARFADDDARRDVRDQLPPPEHRARQVRSDREDRRRHSEAQRARDDRGCAHQVDHDRHDPRRDRSLRSADASPHEDDDRASDAGSVDRSHRPPASWEFERTL